MYGVMPGFTQHIGTMVEYQIEEIRFRHGTTDPSHGGIRIYDTCTWIGSPVFPAVSTRDTRDDKMQRS